MAWEWGYLRLTMRTHESVCWLIREGNTVVTNVFHKWWARYGRGNILGKGWGLHKVRWKSTQCHVNVYNHIHKQKGFPVTNLKLLLILALTLSLNHAANQQLQMTRTQYTNQWQCEALKWSLASQTQPTPVWITFSITHEEGRVWWHSVGFHVHVETLAVKREMFDKAINWVGANLGNELVFWFSSFASRLAQRYVTIANQIVYVAIVT